LTPSREKPLAGAVALVTGASRRIGRATALALAADGAAVMVTAQSAGAEVEAVADDIRQAGGRALAVLMDVTDEASIAAAVARAGTELGPIGILVNNAAIRGQRPFLELSLAEWREVNGVILEGAFLMSRAVLPQMIGRGGGTIVNVGGVSAHIGAASRAHVSAAKAGLVGLTKALAIEFAPRGVTVNCVVPGKIGGQRSATSGHSPIAAEDIPLGREGEIEEAAYAIRMMCQPGARFMTGQTVHVSGGLYMP
jgi:3-oxoacyl-[acyl-carrier protein] reductase